MRRISTLIALFCLAVISQKSFAQDCTPIQPNLSVCSGTVAADFNSSNNGFGTSNGDFTYNPGSYQYTPTANGSAFITSPLYYKTSNMPNAVQVGFTLSTGNKVTITQIKTDVLNSADQVLASCTQNTSISNSSNTQQCIGITSSNLATGTMIKYRFTFTYTIGSGGGTGTTITFDNFSYGGNSNAALPVNFIGFEAKKVSNGTQLTWKVAQEEGVVNYALERSADGKNFSTVGTIAASGSSSYSLTDNQLTTSTAYYRVRNNDKDGRYKYSTTIKVEAGKVSFLKKAYPMPAVNEVFVQHDAAATGAIITLTAQDGRVIRRIQAQTGTMQTRIDLSGLNSGLYMVRYDDGTSNAESLKVVKQ